jgi:hypothetical protein
MTFVQNSLWMGLRSNSILKYFILLLFTFELLAPAFMGGPLAQRINKSSDTQYTQHAGSPDCLTAFLFEESNSEEREGKDYDVDFLFVADTFNVLKKFEQTNACRSYVQDRINSQPALYTLLRVLRI